MHEQVLREVCSSLGITEQEFIETHVTISQGERCEELAFALKGELFESEENTEVIDASLTEDVVLEIFEVMTKDSIEQQLRQEEMEVADEGEILRDALIS